MKRRYNFCNISLDSITDQESFQKVKDYVSSRRYHYQISINVAKMVYAQKDQKLLKSINNADIINADGMPIKKIIDFLSKEKSTRMGGFDYIEGLARLYPRLNYYFLGAKQGVLEKVVSIYKKKYNLNIVGYRNGYFPTDKFHHIVEDINRKNTDILYIGIGTPAKEYLLYDYRNELKCKFAVGVGGAFDIIAGKTNRAPRCVQNCGMEWLYRLCQEPNRMWKRYFYTNSIFVYLVIKEMILKHAKRL